MSILVLASSLLMSCAPSLKEALNHHTLQAPINPHRPVRVDVVASEIRWEMPIALNSSPRRLRLRLAHAIEDALNGPTLRVTRLSQAVPTRFLLEVHSISQSFTRLLFPCFFYGAIFFGCAANTFRADISMTLDYQGELFRVSTNSEVNFSFYEVSNSDEPPELQVVSVAIAKSLQRIADSIAATTAAQREVSR